MRVAVASAIFVMALGLRLWGVGFGLPELFHTDEPAYVLQALAIRRGLPDGLTFANPPLFKYLLLSEYAVVYGLARLAGTTHSAGEFVDAFRADPSQLYLVARVTSAVFGALTVLAAAVLGAAVGGRRMGLIAAGVCAVMYLLVREAHFGTNDSLVTLLVTLGLIFCVRAARDGRLRDYLIAGAVAGLAFAAKYYGIALLIPLLLAHVARTGRRRTIDLALAVLACLAAAVVAFPSLVTEPGRVVSDVYLHLFLGATGGYDGLDPSGGYVFYARALAIGMGWPLLVAAPLGLALGMVRRDRAAIVVGSLPVVLLGVLGSQQLYFARFAMPVLPALAVEASLVLDSLIAVQPVFGVAAALLMSLPTLSDTVRFDALLQQTDTRTLARAWIDTSLPQKATIAVDAPPLGPTLTSAQGHQVSVANEWSLFDLTPADYRSRSIDYVVVSSFTSEPRAIDPAREARRVAFPAELAREATVEAQFRPYATDPPPAFVYDQIYAPFNALDRLERPGPTVTVYRLAR